MRKIIKRKIHISTHKRDLIDFINDEFYSHDKHNAFLEFTMKSLPTDNIIALFYFQKTKRYIETKAFVDGDKFTIEFDTSLINTDETVLGFIYFEKVAQSADVHRFSFGVKVSEIDKLHDIPIEEAKTKRVVAIEDIVTKAELDELFKQIEKNGGTYNDTEIRNSITSIEERVQTLESKTDKDTVYDDSDVKNRLSTLESNSSRYLTEHQSLTSVEERIQQVEARFNNLSNIYLSSHQSLEHLATKDALDKVEQRVEQLEQNRVSDNHDFITRQELEDKHYLTSVPEEVTNQISALENKVQTLENKSVVTHEELESAGYAKTSDLTNLATNSKVEAVENRVLALENKPTIDTNEFAKKSEIPQGYDDSALSGRVSALEAKQDKDTIYNDEEIKRRLTTLEAKPTVDVSAFAKKTEVPTIDSVNTLLRTQGEQLVKINALEAKAGYEIHGTGMPNGKVRAPIGTTYVDTAVTNGALKWIKESGNELTGWKVLVGDTGWRTLKTQSLFGRSFVKVRRVNNIVSYQFGGLEWGLFGLIRRGGNGFVSYGNNPKYCRLTPNYGIPEGFRTVGSVVGPVYNDNGIIIGAWYLGGASDSHHLRFAFIDNIPTDRDNKNMRVSNIMYLTDDDWPTTLP